MPTIRALLNRWAIYPSCQNKIEIVGSVILFDFLDFCVKLQPHFSAHGALLRSYDHKRSGIIRSYSAASEGEAHETKSMVGGLLSS
jgi:hypothetical protein